MGCAYVNLLLALENGFVIRELSSRPKKETEKSLVHAVQRWRVANKLLSRGKAERLPLWQRAFRRIKPGTFFGSRGAEAERSPRIGEEQQVARYGQNRRAAVLEGGRGKFADPSPEGDSSVVQVSNPHLFPPPRRREDGGGSLNVLNDLNWLNQSILLDRSITPDLLSLLPAPGLFVCTPSPCVCDTNSPGPHYPTGERFLRQAPQQR